MQARDCSATVVGVGMYSPAAGSIRFGRCDLALPVVALAGSEVSQEQQPSLVAPEKLPSLRRYRRRRAIDVPVATLGAPSLDLVLLEIENLDGHVAKANPEGDLLPYEGNPFGTPYPPVVQADLDLAL